ncbi:MAG TPA: fibronectin type III domain-containing protein [Bacilli bacterium]|nr:fibronectin type III domain-containing protein [Bacilli bacterium]
MAQHCRLTRTRFTVVLLAVFTLLFTLFPSGSIQKAHAAASLSLSKSVFAVGYPTATVTLTTDGLYLLKQDTHLYLYDANGSSKSSVISDVRVKDDQHLTFSLLPGLPQGDYKLVVMSYSTVTLDLNVLTGYDPTDVIVSPGSDLDIRVDWQDPTAKDIDSIIIQYGPIGQSYYPFTESAALGDKHITLHQNLEHGKAYQLKIYTRKANGETTAGMEFTNGGRGYKAVDATPPHDLTDLRVEAVQNGFHLSWTDPGDLDLDLITVQYAEHGTTNWQGNAVVSRGAQTVEFREMNTAKRYDFRFTKTDTYGNWSYQIDTHGGFGYTFDTEQPREVSSLHASPQSDNAAELTWNDPTTEDFHHANVYLHQENTDHWVKIGRVDKDVESYKLTGLAANIRYEARVTAVDKYGNETTYGTTTRFTVKTVDVSYLTASNTFSLSQEPQGGLELKWDTDRVSSIDYSQFKVMYAPLSEADDDDAFREVTLTNRTNKSAILRDLPSGTYVIQLRLFDSHGIDQVLGSTFDNDGYGYYVSGNNSNLPHELDDVRIQPDSGRNLLLTWNAASTDGTHVEVYYAERSTAPSWHLAAKVDKRDQRYLLQNLSTTKNYFLRLVVLDENRNRTSAGVTYDNSGYGYNVLGGDTYPPHEVTAASAEVSMNTVAITYAEPSDPDFDTANIYVYKAGSTESIQRTSASRGQQGTVLRDLIAGTSYTFRITTVDTYGNESSGITLTNNGQGYLIRDMGVSMNEVRHALLIPQTNKLTVRFEDPLNADYDHAVIALRKQGTLSNVQTKTANKGTNEVTFTNLQSNQPYLVSIVAVSSNGKESSSITLGGSTGITLLPIPTLSDAQVTVGDNRLSVSWNEPSNSKYTAVYAQIKPRGSSDSAWFEPLIVQPGTEKAVFHGLPNDERYEVRLTAAVNDAAAVSTELDNHGSGYRPADLSLYATPSTIERASSGTRTIKLIGLNTHFTWTDDSSVRLYTANGASISSKIDRVGGVTSEQVEVRVDRDLPAGTYQVVLVTPNDGELRTTIRVTDTTPTLLLDGLSTNAVDYNYSAFTMKLTGDGFTRDSVVQIDEGTILTPSSTGETQLSVRMPTNLLPGVHKLTVKNGDLISQPLAFTVYPFRSTLEMTSWPSSRTSTYRGSLNVKNFDRYSRDALVYIVIRRNGEVMETKTESLSFTGYQTKTIDLEFGGLNTPYADGPTHNLSVQAFVVDPYSQAPLADVMITNKDLKL